MKKLLMVLLSVLMVLSLTACGSKTETNKTGNTQSLAVCIAS